MTNLKNGMLCIGSGPSGDDLLVDSKTLEVYFWNHETAEHYNAKDISDCAKLYDSLVALLLHVRNRKCVPWIRSEPRTITQYTKDYGSASSKVA